MSGNSGLIVFQRADPQRLRQEALRDVPAEEHDELGLKLGPAPTIHAPGSVRPLSTT
jgi:hypothetical protein